MRTDNDKNGYHVFVWLGSALCYNFMEDKQGVIDYVIERSPTKYLIFYGTSMVLSLGMA